MPKQKLAPQVEQEPVSTRTRRPARDVLLGKAADLKESVEAIHARTSDLDTRNSLGLAVSSLADVGRALEALPTEAFEHRREVVGSQYLVLPDCAGRYRGLVMPLTVTEVYTDGKLKLCVVMDAEGSKSPGVLFSHLARVEP